jgi:hypothetical protein
VRDVRAAQRRHQPTGEKLARVGDRTSGLVQHESFRHRLALLRGEANLLHRGHGRGDVQDHRLMTLGGEAVREGVGAEDRRPAAGRSDHRNEVGAGEADQAGLRHQSGVGAATKSCHSRTAATAMPLRSRARSIHLCIARVGTVAHSRGLRRRGSRRPSPVTRARGGEGSACPRGRRWREPRARRLRGRDGREARSRPGARPVPQRPRGEVKALEGDGKAAPQVIDAHQPRAFAHVHRIFPLRAAPDDR